LHSTAPLEKAVRKLEASGWTNASVIVTAEKAGYRLIGIVDPRNWSVSLHLVTSTNAAPPAPLAL
jgi:hypothetical protein